MKEKVRVLRIIEYTGDREAVEKIVSGSIHGQRDVKWPEGGVCIRVATIGEYPEILKKGGPYVQKLNERHEHTRKALQKKSKPIRR
jgi:hypothetical protein